MPVCNAFISNRLPDFRLCRDLWKYAYKIMNHEYSNKAGMELIEILFIRYPRRVYRQAGFLFSSVMEKLLAAVFLLIASPLFIVLPIIIKLQDGGQVFYVSRRLGQYKRPYNMYKFRSLTLDAEQKIGGQFLHHKHNVETPVGKFIRETRLDEIPQLINVLLGHMQLLGPRPERPSLYMEQCAHIPGYDKRFNFKPGLFGYSQIFTPHSTPKRIRTFIDNRYIEANENIGFVTVWTIWVMAYLFQRLARRALRVLRERLFLRWKIAQPIDRRALKRIWPRGVHTEIENHEKTANPVKLRLGDINHDSLLLFSSECLSDKPALQLRFDIIIPARTSKRVKTKSARIEGSIRQLKEINENPVGYVYVLDYTAISPLNRYLVDKYLLKDSIV